MAIIEDLKQMPHTDGKLWKEVQELRQAFSPELFEKVEVSSREGALDRVVYTVRRFLNNCSKQGVAFSQINPGHSLGHLSRDYAHALTLVENLDADPKHLFIGGVAGVLHDVGNALVERFAESGRVVRHAEAGALLLGEAFNYKKINPLLDVGLNDAKRILMSYAVAAHTHYTRASEVKCADGEVRKIEPYTDVDAEGKPLLGIWLARWVDRLDCNGPCFPARHYLTLGEEHKDFDGERHFEVNLAPHLEPRLLPEAERRAMNPVPDQTMLEHMKMFGDSQTNNSPYGKHDFGAMVEIRDAYKGMLLEIVNAVDTSAKCGACLTSGEEEAILGAWKSYLSQNIEPTALGRETAEKLDGMFRQLPEKTRHAWENGFLQAMVEYVDWSKPCLQQLEQLSNKYGDQILALPGITEDVRKVITPNPEWVKPAYNVFDSLRTGA
ncbi:hypothetical protein HZC30_01630 [Candidatus Woesearchaeota archaeon]|nr:hypothetical protein [Candidatus Woesearchaeota archaeon]